MIPLTKDALVADQIGWNPIHHAAFNGHSEVIKLLCNLTDNPNASEPTPYNVMPDTPIHMSAKNGHIEVVRILAALTENPNAPNREGETPITVASEAGHTEIVKILVPLADNYNAPNLKGLSPMFLAALHGHSEIVKFLSDTLSKKDEANSLLYLSKPNSGATDDE